MMILGREGGRGVNAAPKNIHRNDVLVMPHSWVNRAQFLLRASALDGGCGLAGSRNDCRLLKTAWIFVSDEALQSSCFCVFESCQDSVQPAAKMPPSLMAALFAPGLLKLAPIRVRRIDSP